MPPGSGVPRIRLSTPDSRRKVMLYASAMNVADMTLMPAMPGTITLRSCWLFENAAPKIASSNSGSRKLKNAALGLRQNSLRSSRYWRQSRTVASAMPHRPGAGADVARGDRLRLDQLGGQLEIDVLETRPRDAQL